MKALVASRLLVGDINDWSVFEREREAANKIANRHAARSVASQIGRSCREVSNETQKFISENFLRCDFNDLARLCDAIQPEIGLYLWQDEFEKALFPLAHSVKLWFPFYAHVSISFWGLQFEYRENHFLQDLDAGLDDLTETRRRLAVLGVTDANMKSKRDDIAPLTRREKFIGRSLISASFSLVEAFLSGVFFTALNKKRSVVYIATRNSYHMLRKKRGMRRSKIDLTVSLGLLQAAQRTAARSHSNPSLK